MKRWRVRYSFRYPMLSFCNPRKLSPPVHPFSLERRLCIYYEVTFSINLLSVSQTPNLRLYSRAVTLHASNTNLLHRPQTNTRFRPEPHKVAIHTKPTIPTNKHVAQRKCYRPWPNTPSYRHTRNV